MRWLAANQKSLFRIRRWAFRRKVAIRRKKALRQTLVKLSASDRMIQRRWAAGCWDRQRRFRNRSMALASQNHRMLVRKLQKYFHRQKRSDWRWLTKVFRPVPFRQTFRCLQIHSEWKRKAFQVPAVPWWQLVRRRTLDYRCLHLPVRIPAPIQMLVSRQKLKYLRQSFRTTQTMMLSSSELARTCSDRKVAPMGLLWPLERRTAEQMALTSLSADQIAVRMLRM